MRFGWSKTSVSRRALLALVAVAAVLVLACPPVSSARSYYMGCGSPFGGISIIEHGTSCDQARKVMRKVYVKSQEVAPENGVLYARGWSCTLNPYEKRGITCRRDSGVIKGPTPG